MGTNEKVTEALIECLTNASSECRVKILEEWELEIFPQSNEVKEYLQRVYDSCKT